MTAVAHVLSPQTPKRKRYGKGRVRSTSRVKSRLSKMTQVDKQSEVSTRSLKQTGLVRITLHISIMITARTG